ncbi:MAG: HAD-IC family P-type ATPase [Patescibacteria group bacterium]|nr:HAD-IC family P-type ATPase [Patescibacteria group bacterium]
MNNLFEFASQGIDEIISELKTSKDGLSSKEYQKRINIYGLNKISSFKINLLEIIKNNSLNFFNLFLFFAGILSIIIKGIEIESILIFFFLFISALVAVIQDYRMNKLSQELLSYFKNYAWVKRENRWVKIEAEYLVPGDYIKVTTGHLIPADIRIILAKNVLVDESIITGESEPVIKKVEFNNNEGKKNDYPVPENIALMGTTLIKGEMEGIVFATGKKTYFGSIAKQTLEIKKETAYQKMLNKFTQNMSLVGILVILLVILVNLFKQNYTSFEELLIFAIVLAVAIVPEFLPAMTTLTLTLTGLRLAKKGLVIKRLSAIEDLGAVEVLCTDKTGTITTNKLKLEKIISEDKEKFIKYFLSEYYFTKEISPYEEAIFYSDVKENLIFQNENKLKKNLISKSLLEQKLSEWFQNTNLIEEINFDPDKRISQIFINDNNKRIEIIKGAPERIIKICCEENISRENIEEIKKIKNYWLHIFNEEDKKGFRTLALAVNNQILGIISFSDPLKETTYEAIKLAKDLNLEIKILTGDSPQVAKNVGLKLGLIKENEMVILGEEIKNLEGEELKKIVNETKIFARVLPEDKLKIIQVLQKEKFVAFLGEGINDAVGLKMANVAIAVDNATDVVKQEADVILKEKDLKKIIDGIYEGRKVLENIGKYIKHTMSGNFGNLGAIAFLSSILNFPPLTSIQVLLTNFITDIPIIAFADDNVKINEIKKPIKISNKNLVTLLLLLGLIAAIINIFGYLIVKNESISLIQTYIFFITTMTGLIVCFSIRTKDWFIFSKPSKLTLISLVLGLIFTLFLVFLPYFNKIFGFANLNWQLILFSFLLLIIFFIFNEIVKKFFYQKFPDTI